MTNCVRLKTTLIPERCNKETTRDKQEQDKKTGPSVKNRKYIQTPKSQEEIAWDCHLVEGHLPPYEKTPFPCSSLMNHSQALIRQKRTIWKTPRSEPESPRGTAGGAKSQSPRSSLPFSVSGEAWQQWAQPRAAGDNVHLTHRTKPPLRRTPHSFVKMWRSAWADGNAARSKLEWNVQDEIIDTSPKRIIFPPNRTNCFTVNNSEPLWLQATENCGYLFSVCSVYKKEKGFKLDISWNELYKTMLFE